ncbi:unnamed protein product [Parajaminaea phylloscopi]
MSAMASSSKLADDPSSSGAKSVQLCTALSSSSHSSYRLLELTDDVAQLIEEAQERRLEKLRSQHACGATNGRKRKSPPPTDLQEGDDEDDRPHLVINGRNQDEAVLCTSSKTYALREISQSNSLLLCSIDEVQQKDAESDGKAMLVVRSNTSSIFELSPAVPRLERITSLLQDSMFEGRDAEAKKSQRRYTPREVRSVVQASDAELQEGYDARHVVLLDGFMRLVSPSYLKDILRSLILIIAANSYLPEKVPLTPAVTTLMEEHKDSLRTEVAHSMLTRWFGKINRDDGDGSDTAPNPADETSSVGDARLSVNLDAQRIAYFFGQECLKETGRQRSGKSTTHSDFMSSWRSLMGDCFPTDTVSLELLRGQYLLHPAPPARPRDSDPLTITYYPAHQLPLDPPARFQELFLTRPSWTLEDLEPFIRDVAVDAKRREALLLRFARAKKVKVPAPAPPSGVPQTGRRDAAANQTVEVTLYSARVRY